MTAGLEAHVPLSILARRRAVLLHRSALFVATAALQWVGAAWLETSGPLDSRPLLLWAAGAAASAAFVATAFLAIRGHPRAAQAVFLAGLAAGGWPFALRLFAAPTVAFLAFSWAALASVAVLFLPRWLPGRAWFPRDEDPRTMLSPVVTLTSSVALVVTAVSVGHQLLDSPLGRWSLFALLALAALAATAVEWTLVHRGSLASRRALALSAVTATGCALAALPQIWPALAVLSARTAAALVGAVRASELYGPVHRFLWSRPALLVLATFAGLSLGGGLVLTFPACTTRPISELDALFTAASAACVTGLTVLDTAGDFTFGGLLVIVGLIQVGALGIMTLSAAAVLLLGGSLGSTQEGRLGELVGTATPASTFRLLKRIALFTLAIETLGAAALYPAFLAAGVPPHGALWKALFHAVSAFCNAGFALQADSLVSFHRNPAILHIVSLLIMAGGIGFGVLVALGELLAARRGFRRFPFQGKLVLATSAALWLGGWAAILVLEWNGALAAESVGDKLTSAWLHSVTLRTAGFNSVPMDAFQPATHLLMITWMFVGASPGSTGGGIKTTTLAVLLLAVKAVLAGQGEVQAFGRRIDPSTVHRAAAVAVIALAFVLAGSFVLLLAETISFRSALFEAVSAFGTVGLSLGATAELDAVGKVMVIVLMLAGRTGPLTTMFLFLQTKPRRLRYPQEEVLVG